MNVTAAREKPSATGKVSVTGTVRGASPSGAAPPMPWLAWLPKAIAHAPGWKRPAIGFAAGAFSVLAMAPFFLSPVLFLTLPVLIWLIDGAGPLPRGRPTPDISLWRIARRAATSGWWFGFGYFVVGLHWIGEAFLVEADVFAWLLPFAVTLLPAGLAIFFAVATGLARLAWSRGLARILVLAVSLALAEWVRGHAFTGFPWNTLGYALTFPLPLMQTAGVLGIYGLTLWTIAIFAAPLVLWADARRDLGRRSLVLAITAALVPFILLAGGGIFILKRQPMVIDDGARLRIVQPSIPQREKWLAEKQAANFSTHLELSRTDPQGRRDDLAKITHVIWPEAAMPFLPLERPEAMAIIGDLLPPRTYLVSGAIRVKRPTDGQPGPTRAYNSLLVLGENGTLAAIYDKIHLVPFGEYLPLQEWLEAIGLQQLSRLRGGFSAGDSPRPLLSIPGLPQVGALICYEAIFPSETVQSASRPGIFLNLTNDGWFGTTIGPHQHLHQARVRAVEQGIPLIRAANNGISAVIDAQGRVLARLELNVKGVIDTGVPRVGPPPIYTRFGNGIFAVMVLIFLAWATALRQRPHS